MFDAEELQILKDMEARTDKRFEAVDQRFQDMEARMDQRFQDMEARMDQRFQDMEERIIAQSAANMRVLLESYVEPKFNLLAEGQKMLLETLAPKNRVEQLEDEVAFMKQVIKAMSQDIAELKKAQ